jgi:serine/threonine protein kinase
LEALEYLHLQELIHRDIKSSNFLLDSEWKCKLSDFGMARQVAKDGKMTICGTVSNFNVTTFFTPILRTGSVCG